MQDVVCGMEINQEDAAASAEHDGRKYYFCSETCRGKFVKDPARYASGFHRTVEKERSRVR